MRDDEVRNRSYKDRPIGQSKPGEPGNVWTSDYASLSTGGMETGRSRIYVADPVRESRGAVALQCEIGLGVTIAGR